LNEYTIEYQKYSSIEDDFYFCKAKIISETPEKAKQELIKKDRGATRMEIIETKLNSLQFK
jgi:hypothetical protein